jgi:ABC-type multidrug transport system fused ATPase/permease subunit
LLEYSLKDVRRHFLALFQTFVNYSLTLRESVALSDVDRIEDTTEIIKALKLSGIYEKCEEFEDGLETMMTRRFDDRGAELSKGQWQKLSLARAYFKNAEVIIFDDPSAAFNPISEDRIFEQLYKLSEGKSSVTISHRLSNTMLADKIIVLNQGKIAEQGSHFELLKQNGKYAYLFDLQESTILCKSNFCKDIVNIHYVN